MASILNVDTINNAAGTSALTIDSSGNVAIPGHVMQVVSTIKTDTYSESVAAGSPTGVITGLTVSITPKSSSNKILILFSVTTNQQATYLMLDQGGSTIFDATGDAASNRSRVFVTRDFTYGEFYMGTMAGQFLHSPATTSQLTYGIRLRHSSTASKTLYVNRGGDDSDTAQVARAASTITVMEIAG